MNNRDTYMNFDVYLDLEKKDKQYNIQIELENEVDSHVREAVISLSGTIVRNNFANMYKTTLNDNDLSMLILEKLNTWIPGGHNFKAKTVNVGLKKLNVR